MSLKGVGWRWGNTQTILIPPRVASLLGVITLHCVDVVTLPVRGVEQAFPIKPEQLSQLVMNKCNSK